MFSIFLIGIIESDNPRNPNFVNPNNSRFKNLNTPVTTGNHTTIRLRTTAIAVRVTEKEFGFFRAHEYNYRFEPRV